MPHAPHGIAPAVAPFGDTERMPMNSRPHPGTSRSDAPGTPRMLAPPAGPSVDDWNLLRTFIAVYEAGTLTEAAQRLGSTQPNLGRHIRALEALLGEALFVRLPGRLKPTERAHGLHATLLPMKAAVQEAGRLFAESGARVAGTVRLTVSEVYASHVVAPLAAQWLAEQPGLEIELSVSNRAENLLRRDADIAVRFFRPEQDDVIALHVGNTELGLYAHESFIARHGEPTGYTLAEEAFVAGFDRETSPLAPMMKGAPPPQPVRFRLRTDAALARQAAVETGFGVGAYLVDVAAEHPGLRRILAERFGQPLEVWLCAHAELRRSASMRFVWSRLEQALRQRLAPVTTSAVAPPTAGG
jgi:DNA-binding transcriptional LysR family regulator